MIAEDDLLPYLRRDDRQIQLNGLRSLKNSVIGHTEQKASYLDRGVLDDLLGIINLQEDGVKDPLLDECRIEAGVVLGSFAYSEPEISTRLFTPHTFATLVNILSVNTPPSLLVAGLRTLATLLTAQPATSFVNQFPTLPSSLAALIQHYSSAPLAQLSRQDVQVLTSLCAIVPLISPSHASTPALGSALTPPLVNIVHVTVLRKPQSEAVVVDRKLQSTAILALAHVLTPAAARELAYSAPEFIDALVALLRAPETATRLSAASLLTTLYTSELPEAAGTSGVTRAPQNKALALILVPTLMKLLDDAIAAGDSGRKCDPRILHTLAIVCREGGEVTDRCVEVGLIKKIVSICMAVAPNNHFSVGRIVESDGKLLSGGLLCLSALGLHKEEYRKAIIDAGTLGVVVAVMNRANTPAAREVKIAACHVLRTLSRSVLLLRTTIVESGVVGGVVDLLGQSPSEEEQSSTEADTVRVVEVPEPVSEQKLTEFAITDVTDDDDEEEEDLEVRTAAMAAVCNLVLEFSPLRKPILDKGILPLIVSGARSRYAPLRLNSVWALKHMVYGDDMETKARVLSHLGFPLLLKLCNDKEIQVQEQALDFIRNLIARSENYIDMFLDNVGVEEIFQLIDGKLGLESSVDGDYVDQDPISTDPYYTEIVICAAYILVHIAAGYDRHREIVIAHDSVLRKVIQLMQHERDEVRLACVWIIINLTWIEEPSRAAANMAGQGSGAFAAGLTREQESSSELYFTDICRRRAATLVRLGAREQLDLLKQDHVLDVREKTKTAICQIDYLVGGPAVTEADGEEGAARPIELASSLMDIDSDMQS